jgi:C_GCAxxG_C_C family probable redox protein
MKTREQLLEEVYRRAYRYEAERGSCPQCVLSAIIETLGVGDPGTVKAVDALAGGTALSTEGTCGALVGGLLAISSIVGRSYNDFSKGGGNRRVFLYAKKLYDRFVEEYGSPVCKDVQTKIFGRSFKLLDSKEYKEFEKMGAHVDKCPSVSGNAARWAAEIILDDLKIKK